MAEPTPDTPTPDTELARVVSLLGEIGEIGEADSESVVVQVATTRASVRVVELAEGLDVISVTQLVALNLPNTDTLRDDVEKLGAGVSFGSLRRSDPVGATTDVLLYYTFPLGGLTDIALLTVLHIVLGTGADVGARLAGVNDDRG
ncbi:MAG: hypothetical protein QM673_09345 [Gordonia sp. (in: high G+C Gram-positive bacteria)]